VLFLLGSALAGASQSMNQLIIFRGVQGLGSGVGIALIATLMADLFPPNERAKWGGLVGAVYGISSLLGSAVGGWLVEYGPLGRPMGCRLRRQSRLDRLRRRSSRSHGTPVVASAHRAFTRRQKRISKSFIH